MNTYITYAADKCNQVAQTISLPTDWLAHTDGYALKLERELHFEVSESGVSLRSLLAVAIEDAERIAQALKNAANRTIEEGT
ncbi:hypothetical protein F6R98_02895 [Candidatus Methylospira mobilis]|uniref:Uncharacterized protein n=1 Tax=Candidatus Methylospira mobilis TaxID=1808979 RepID=A0A5Q0BHS0_9GAMM|nr:hypothetical protein [Candidatus Methylospira mobilis]QFY41704.1 hypothetical protein F6R98_02895 [Candidatus Methylospira mobilis]